MNCASKSSKPSDSQCQMPTYIDESGDTGRTRDGGTPYFRLAAVWIPTIDDAQRFREQIRHLRLQIALRADYEFKYAKTHTRPERRKAFFNTALAQEFRFAVSSIDKTKNEWNSADRGELHWACTTELAALLRPLYHRAEQHRSAPLRERVVIDDNSDHTFLVQLKRQFRGLRSSRWDGSSLVDKVSFRDSAVDELLQLADMVCGAVGDFVDGSDWTWYNLIAERDVERRDLL